MNNSPEAKGPHEYYDIGYETAACRNMLERRTPKSLNTIKLTIVDSPRGWSARQGGYCTVQSTVALETQLGLRSPGPC